MKPHIYAVAPLSSAIHRMNRLLAALEPHLRGVNLWQDQVLNEAGDPLRHVYFPMTRWCRRWPC